MPKNQIRAEISEENYQKLLDLIDITKKELPDLLNEALEIGLQEVRILFGVEKYKAGIFSIGKLSEFTGVSYREIYGELNKRGVKLRINETLEL